MKIGIIKENKIPRDKRVPFTPMQCVSIKQRFGVEVVVQSSLHRAYTDQEYKNQGISIVDNVEDCDILFGVKEVPKEDLIAGKTYFFFSHTIKKQPYNKTLLQEILNKNIRLIDYECLRFPNRDRVLGFGRFAGIVGTYNGLDAYGQRNKLFSLKPAHLCFDYEELKNELKKVNLSGVKILVTGEGRVSSGIVEILEMCGVQRVEKEAYNRIDSKNPVFVQLNYDSYYRMKVGAPAFDKQLYFNNPESVESNLGDLWSKTDILITGHYWDHRSGKLFSIEEARKETFKTKVIADITCDINGSVPLTIRPTVIGNPVFGINPHTMQETEPYHPDSITMMTVDNLPCELPRDASYFFGEDLLEKVLPSLLIKDDQKIIERATITKNGKLTDAYTYLSDYVAG
jgi:alanine dehydrogenase